MKYKNLNMRMFLDENRMDFISIAVFKPIRFNDLREDMKPLIGKLVALETSFFQDEGEFENQQTYVLADGESPMFWIPEEDLIFLKKVV